MKWLITTKRDVDLASLREKLNAWGCEATSLEQPIPLDEDEQVFEIMCPSAFDLREKARGEATILQINPSSELELLGPGTDFQIQ